MKRAVCGVVVFIIVAGLVAGLVATHRGRLGGPVYTVDTVVSGLHQQPTVWAGRTILVRGAIIWYEAWYWDLQQQGFSEDGCTDDRYPTVSACQRSIAWDLAHLQPGSTVRLVIAPQARLFTNKATGEEIVPQSPSGATVEEIVPQTPPGAMVVRFHVPPGGVTAAGPLTRLLRQVPVVASLVPAWAGSAIPTQGVYHLHLGAHPTHDEQHDQNNGALLPP